MKSDSWNAPDVRGDANTSSNPHLLEVASRRVSRRAMLGGMATSLLGGLSFVACSDGSSDPLQPGADGGTGDAKATDSAIAADGATADADMGDADADADAAAEPPFLGFKAVPKSVADVLTVPMGYTATVLYRTGDPLDMATTEYPNDGTTNDFDHRAGDQHDGMEFFGLDAAGTKRDPAGSSRGVLGMNHENVVDWALHPSGATPAVPGPRPKSEVDREMGAHGLSFVEIAKVGGKFAVDKTSRRNRRITASTPIELAGPVRGNGIVATKYSVGGTATRGTINNCGTGVTPWGTLLSGEENWASYVYRAAGDDTARGGATAKSVVALARYGATEGANAFNQRWDGAGTEDAYARWNGSQTAGTDATTDYRNVLNTFGYVVEIDPYDPTARVQKRTALGRMAHEGASFQDPKAGKSLVVYMGDDSRNEYIYKFVSKAKWSDADANATDRIAVGSKYLDEGTLYAAKFAADGTGTWEELSLANPKVSGYAKYAFADLADVLVHARIAADAAGATKMDRPEWCSVHPKTQEVYFSLTNNSRRTPTLTDGPNPRAYADSKPTKDGGTSTQTGNVNGHILRLAETGGEPSATTFTWDVYLFGAESGADGATVNLSGLTEDNDFSSPDGLWFSPYTGVCWIQTDDSAYTDVTNCMMLAALPGKVGDGESVPLSYALTDADGGDAGSRSIATRRGAKPTTATLKRFLVGPVDCELTGVTETPDGRTMFVNIQHPGETTLKDDVGTPAKYTSHWPDGGNARPRSATVVITKDDGGRIGT
ncbi:MAG: DUF839 domain-containing protein [Polyangiaceae bacterium]